MRKLLKKQGFSPKLLITDKLRSHTSAFWRLGLSCLTNKGSDKTIGRKTRIRWCDDAQAVQNDGDEASFPYPQNRQYVGTMGG
jgi:transposase-like protein